MKYLSSETLKPIISAYRAADKRLLLLDYDGTLIPIAPTPQQAKPLPEVLTCLDQLDQDSKNTVVIISGRDRQMLDNWLGHMPLNMVAEHGAFEKTSISWRQLIKSVDSWKNTVRPILIKASATVDGSLVEEKETGLVFHYRTAKDAHLAQRESDKLVDELLPLVEPLGLVVAHDNMAVEIKPVAANKGTIGSNWLKSETYDFVLAAGDAATDEDMFKALPAECVTIKVGQGPSLARYRVESPKKLIELLADLTKV